MIDSNILTGKFLRELFKKMSKHHDIPLGKSTRLLLIALHLVDTGSLWLPGHCADRMVGCRVVVATAWLWLPSSYQVVVAVVVVTKLLWLPSGRGYRVFVATE